MGSSSVFARRRRRWRHSPLRRGQSLYLKKTSRRVKKYFNRDERCGNFQKLNFKEIFP
jgi:hypothetical protein